MCVNNAESDAPLLDGLISALEIVGRNLRTRIAVFLILKNGIHSILNQNASFKRSMLNLL